jgi:hypothetical protein
VGAIQPPQRSRYTGLGELDESNTFEAVRTATAAITVYGERYPEHIMQMLGRLCTPPKRAQSGSAGVRDPTLRLRETRGDSNSRVDLVQLGSFYELWQLAALIHAAGGAALGAYRDPLGGRPFLVAPLPLAAVQPAAPLRLPQRPRRSRAGVSRPRVRRAPFTVDAFVVLRFAAMREVCAIASFAAIPTD